MRTEAGKTLMAARRRRQRETYATVRQAPIRVRLTVEEAWMVLDAVRDERLRKHVRSKLFTFLARQKARLKADPPTVPTDQIEQSDHNNANL